MKLSCRIFLIASVATLASSCVAFRAQQMSDELDSKYATIVGKLSVNFTNQSVLRGPNGQETVHPDTKAIVEGYMLSASGFFITTQSLAGEEDLHFRFKTVSYTEDSSLLRRIPLALYLAASIATAGIIPYFEFNSRHLEAEVIQAGKVLKKYGYKDQVLLVTSLLVLPWWRYDGSGEGWYETATTTSKVDYNLVKHFLQDFHRDFMTKHRQPAEAAASSS